MSLDRQDPAPINVLLIDDQPLFSLGVVHALKGHSEFIEIRTAQTLDDGIELASRWSGLNTVLLHERLAVMPSMYGLRCVAFKCPNAAPVLMAASEDPTLIAQAQAAGAQAVLQTTSSPLELTRALESVCRGHSRFAYHPPARQVEEWQPPTPRQVEVLRLIARGRQNKQIACELGIAERTVKLHVTALFSITGARNRTHLLVRAKELGLLS
ncbi:response regulator transcription factor [Niveibacterium sp.]|uniref:response regulator transcription factor n=1 Tax=Niveibacterium sp. TaxID=2017444 RepID=UPI0035AEDF29